MLTIQAADRWVILAVAKVEIIRFSRENEKENEREWKRREYNDDRSRDVTQSLPQTKVPTTVFFLFKEFREVNSISQFW